ncbi:MAG TPA: universal stress protein, UspA [Gammaproteobacteria bacterium]|nr:universal stress protein, UspA [Gammaproteobacteria bacterium]
MQRFKNILLVLDPEAQETAALDKAVSLARQNAARLTLFSVVYRHPDLRRYPDSVGESLMDPLVAERQQWLRGFLPTLQGQDIGRVSVVVAAGIPFLGIIREVLREQHDLVITTAEEKKGIRARVFGATSMHLMRKCPCPVWVVKRAQARPYARILAAVDPSPYDPKRDSLSALVLQLAGSMARREAAGLHIVHVWHMFGESYVRRGGMTGAEVEEAKALEKLQQKQRFDLLLGQSDVADLKPCLHFIEGYPDERIPELVVEQDIDLLVMGTVCRTGVAGFLIGNTAEEVLNQVDCSVLTLKPEGFVTPVTLE